MAADAVGATAAALADDVGAGLDVVAVVAALALEADVVALDDTVAADVEAAEVVRKVADCTADA